MAAPMLTNAIRSCLKLRCLELGLPASCQQLRFKKNPKRSRAPSVAKEKGRFVGKSQKKFIDTKPVKVNPDFLKKVPEDDVWIRLHYPLQRHSMEEAIVRHKEMAQPDILNNMDGLVYAEMTIDMRTTKKIKVIRAFRETVLPPHRFNDSTEKRVALFCSNEADKKLATEMGVTYVGGLDLVKQIQDNDIDVDSLDFLLCVPDMMSPLLPLRPILRDKFPARGKGHVNQDVKTMLDLFINGITFNCVKETDEVGKIQAPLGKLSMNPAELMENYYSYLPVILRNKPTKTVKFITELSVIAPPSDEQFYLRVENYAPGYEKEDRVVEESDDEEEEMSASV